MSGLGSIPVNLLERAAALPSNAHASEALRRAAGFRGHSTTHKASSVAQGATGAAERAESRDGEYRCEIVPVGKPRQTQSDKWKERGPVVRYRAFADELRAWAERVGFCFPDSGCHMRFEIPMPRTWSESKKAAMQGQPHQQRPDVDNICKGIFDALRPDDCRVWQVSAEKRWARSGAIVFRLLT